MNRIGYLHSKPSDPEIATLEISEKDHDELHKDALAWVNKHKVFPKDVSSVKVAPHLFEPKKGQTWQLVVIHELHCSAVVVCVPA